jgi:hypothetical protein
MRVQFRGEKTLGDDWRARLERTLRLELSRFAGFLARIVVTVREDRALCVELVLDSGEALDFTARDATEERDVVHLAQQAARSLSHLAHSSSFKKVS